MTRGLSRSQIGVTDAQIETYGELIFKLSHNHQIRRGDPIRHKQFDAIEASRAELGMSDAQIATHLGLHHDQVTFIRNVMERERFRRHHYHRLYELGGGRRFRADRFEDPFERRAFGEDALRLKNSMRFRGELAQRYTREGWWNDDTLSSWLGAHAHERPDAIALIDEQDKLSWRELKNRADRCAEGFASLGVGAGDVVSIQLPNTITFLVTYLAVMRLGGVVSTIYMPHRAAEYRMVLEFAKSTCVVLPSTIGDFPSAHTAVSLKSEITSLRHVIAVGAPIDGAIPYKDVADARIATGADSSYGEPNEIVLDSFPEPVGADPFLLLFTSGTTSAPKAVPLSYQNMLSNARLSAPEHRLSEDDVIMCAAPFGHLYALYSFHLAMATGATTALLPVFSPPALAAAMANLKPTALFAGPPHMAACLGADLLRSEQCDALRLVVLSGSNLPPELALKVASVLPNGGLSQLWGMTETQAGLYTRPDDPVDVVANSAGRPSPGTEVRVSDTEGQILGTDVEGELQIRGCLLFPGYLDNDAANESSFDDEGWFFTGDLATIDDAGNVAITGRSRDVINRGGVKYNPKDIEDLLDAHPQLLQCAIVALPDPTLGERACCFATPSGDAQPSLESLCDYLLDKGIAKYKLPERLEYVSEMPLTPTRKIIKSKLKGAYS